VAAGAEGPGIVTRARVSRPPVPEKVRLPDFAQHTPADDVFPTRLLLPTRCDPWDLFIDGSNHTGYKARDRTAREAFEDRGHRLVAITEQIKACSEIFIPVASGS
jgi:hypothetical protein